MKFYHGGETLTDAVEGFDVDLFKSIIRAMIEEEGFFGEGNKVSHMAEYIYRMSMEPSELCAIAKLAVSGLEHYRNQEKRDD